MTDTTAHNTLVTILIGLAILIAIGLFGRTMQPMATRSLHYRLPASAIDAGGWGAGYPDEYHYQSVTAYSRPSASTTTTYTTYEDTAAAGYQCASDYSVCWTTTP